MMLGIVSCQKNENLDSPFGGEAAVTVSAALPAEMDGTRAAGDGTQVNRCQMEVYLDGQLYGERKVAVVSGGIARFEMRVVAGKTYDFVFWADAANGSAVEDFADNHYDTGDFSNVVIKDAAAYKGNDDTRDAFFGKETVEITASQPVTAKLYRPFGQLNIKTLDIQEVKDANIASLIPSHVSIAFENVPTGIDLLTGKLTEATSPVAYFEKSAVIDENGTLSMDYVFAPDGTEQYLANFTMSFFNAEGGEAAADYGFTTIPVQRNYRTNVSGNFLTKKTDITVDVIPDFENEEIDVLLWDGSATVEITPVEKEVDGAMRSVYVVDTPAQLAWVGEQLNNNNAAVKFIELAADIDMGGNAFVIKRAVGVTLDGNNHKISNYKASNVQAAGLFAEAISSKFRNLTVSGADVKAVNDGGGNAYAGAIIGRSYGTIVFDNCTVMNSKVEGVNKVGGMIGFVAENHIEAADCKVVGSVISTEYVDGESGQIGGFAGYLGSQYNSTCSFANCSVEDCVINAHMGELGTKRAIGKFIGCMQASAATDILTVDNCSVNNVTLNRLNDNAKAYLSVHGDMLGGKRNAAGEVTITGCDTNIYVSTPEQLRYFATLVNGGDTNFANKVIALENDIDLSAAEWTPVNSWNGILNGLVLDGAGYTVSGMHINNTATASISLGFFNNNASKMTVKNITFDDARIIDKTNANQHYAGVIMGKNYSVVTFEQVHVTNSIVINNWQCGGLCGYAEGNAPVFNGCSISDSFVGGYNATSGTMFGLGQVDVVGSGCSATNVELYTDGLTWNSTQQQLGNFFVGSLYGKSLNAGDYVETNVTVVAEYPEGYR